MAKFGELVLAACADVWDREWIVGRKNRDNCSGFLKAVAAAVCVPLPATATADELVDHMDNNWRKLDTAGDSLKEVAKGNFVVAGLKGSNHNPARGQGHVAIVIDGALYRNVYPKVWGGSTGAAQSRGDQSTGEIWNTRDRNSVSYYAYDNPTGCR